MSEKKGWPSWLKKILPAWLETIGYPAPGVGDLGDLKFEIGVGENGKWIGFVNTGWFYHCNLEQYHYVVPGNSVVTASSGVGTVTASVSFRPSWGPVLVNGNYFSSSSNVTDSFTYGLASNPYGEWSIGYKPTIGGSFSVFSAFSTGLRHSSGALVRIDNWRRSLNLPAVGSYTSQYPLYMIYDGTYAINSYFPFLTDGVPAAVLQPGALSGGAEIACARYTVPRNGAYSVLATFGSGDVGTVRARVLKNTTVLFDTTAASTMTYSNTIAVTAGDTLDFEVHPSPDDLLNDSTPISVTVTQVSGTSETIPYTQHGNSFYPAATMAWFQVGTSDVYYCNVPSNCYVTGVRDLTYLTLGAVSATGAILNEKLYYYDVLNKKLYIKPKNPASIQIYPDLLYTYPFIRMRELVVQEDGLVKASYSGAIGLSDVVFSRGSQTVLKSGLQTTNSWTNPITGCNDGDWVVLEYYVCRSYVLADHKTLTYYTLPTTGETITINWETSVPDVLTAATLASGTSSFNLNPLFPDAYRTGYLMHALPSSGLTSYWKPGKMFMSLDKDKVFADLGELVKLTIEVRGDNDLPIPYYPFTLSYTGTATAIGKHPTTNTTDGRGEIHVLFQPATGTTTFSVTGTCGTLTQVVSASVTTLASSINSSRWNAGLVNLAVTDRRGPDGGYICYVNVTNLDGIPISAPSPITIMSKKASQFGFVDTNGTSTTYVKSFTIQPVSTADNIMGMVKFTYLPQPDDELVAYCGTAQTPIIDGDK